MLQIKEDFVNRTEGYRYGDSGYYEPLTDGLGNLYKDLRGKYGRCIGNVYQDTPDGTPDKIGWVFLKRAKYTDSKETYLQETWITYKWVKG